MPSANRPAGVVIPLNDWAVKCRRRAFASHLVQAPSLAMSLLAPLGDEPPRIEVRSALALIVNDAAIREQRAIVLIEGGQFI